MLEENSHGLHNVLYSTEELYTKVSYFLKIFCNSSHQNAIFSDISMSQVRAAAILLLFITEN
jgi:hypothetical protein